MIAGGNSAGQGSKHIGGRHNRRPPTGIDDHSDLRLLGGSVSGGVRDSHIWLNITEGVGVGTDLTPENAEVLIRKLSAWVAVARRNRAQDAEKPPPTTQPGGAEQ